MSTIERKEYQETKIMRTVSPVRRSNQNLSEFDHNLGYLLDDLQNSVSRPGSSLGSHRDTSKSIETSKGNSLNRFANVKASNPVTEYSSDDTYNYTSPDGTKRIAGYKKESYSYKSSGPEKVRMQNNINQLDSLLDDLQQVKNTPLPERDSFNNTGVDPDFQRSSTSSKRSVQRELHYGDTPRSSSRSRTLERTERKEREGSLNREIQYTNEGTYGDLRPIRGRSPSPSSKTSTLTKQTKVTNVHNYPMEVVETTTPDINPEILAHLDPSLHPPGNTKVTTTIKTFTYEIPGTGNYPTNLDPVDTEKYVYSPNQTQTTPSKSFVYKKVDNTTENVVDYPSYKKSSPPGFQETVTTRSYQPGYTPDAPPVKNQTYVYNETTTTRHVDDRGSLPRQNPPQTYIIEERHTTNRNVNRGYPDDKDYPRGNPPRQDTYIVKEVHDSTTTNRDYPPTPPPPTTQKTYIKEIHDSSTTSNVHHPYPNGHPPNEPNKTIVYKHETHTTNNYGPGGRPRPDVETSDPKYPPNEPKTIIYRHETHNTSNYGPGDKPRPDVESFDPKYPPNEPKTIIYRHETHTTSNNYGPGGKPRPDVDSFDPKHPPYGDDGRRPNEPVNIHYRYKTESTTTNNYKAGYPPSDETQALLPKPFPTDNQGSGPPKRLDELLANIGNEPPNSPYNASFNAHEQELEQKKKIDTLKRQQEEVDDSQKKEAILKSKNVSGPPVYYPPGHELFARKEESDAWRAEGGYQKASGKYKYEAESKSKSKSSSGAAVVPVCLPLCCGLPCAIL